MQFTTIAAAFALATAVSAYEVLTPTLNATVAKGESLSIEWSSVDTDAEVFSVYLANFVIWPPTVLSLAQNVPRDDGAIDLVIPCNVNSDYGWQINFINGTNTYVIYAQSDKFFLTGDCIDPEPTSTAAPFPTGYTNTTTVHAPGTTVLATATATLIKTVETVIYSNPVVWFVEPSAEAVCDAVAPAKTVTVYADGPAPVTCGAGPVVTSAPYVPATATPTYHASGTGAIKPTSTPEFTGAASSVRVGGAAAMIIGAAALLL